jgi:hypothetical protein
MDETLNSLKAEFDRLREVLDAIRAQLGAARAAEAGRSDEAVSLRQHLQRENDAQEVSSFLFHNVMSSTVDWFDPLLSLVC